MKVLEKVHKGKSRVQKSPKLIKSASNTPGDDDEGGSNFWRGMKERVPKLKIKLPKLKIKLGRSKVKAKELDSDEAPLLSDYTEES